MPTVDRNIGEVLDLMMKIPGLPDEHRIELSHIRSSVGFTAPEQVGLLWQRMAGVVNRAVQQKDAVDLRGWEIELVELMTDRKIAAFFPKPTTH